MRRKVFGLISIFMLIGLLSGAVEANSVIYNYNQSKSSQSNATAFTSSSNINESIGLVITSYAWLGSTMQTRTGGDYTNGIASVFTYHSSGYTVSRILSVHNYAGVQKTLDRNY